MNFQQHKDSLLSFAQKQDLEWRVYLDEVFRKKNPEPVLRHPKMKQAIKQETPLSLKFWLALFVAISAVGVSGMRVFDRFYNVSYVTSNNTVFSGLEALFGVIAVNIGIIAMSFAVAYTKKKMSEQSMGLALLVAVVISLVAGLGQGFAGLKLDVALGVFDWVLAIVLALVTALEYFSGDMLGVEWFLHEQQRITNQTNYDNEQRTNREQYEQELRTSEQNYEHEHREWMRTAKAQFGLWKANYEQWNKTNSLNEHITNNEQPKQRTVRTRSTNNKELVRKLIEQHYEQTNELISYSELMRTLVEHLGLDNEQSVEFVRSKKGYVSDIRTEWAKERGLK